MPVFGLGTWQMGGRTEHDLSNDDEADIAAIRRALDAGITHIDTAEHYAHGYAEILVGKAIVGYDRSKLFVVSKVFPENITYEDVSKACKKSLERVGIDYFDLYLIHWYDPALSLKDFMKALDGLKE